MVYLSLLRSLEIGIGDQQPELAPPVSRIGHLPGTLDYGLTTAWTQYTNRRGPPEEFLALQVASAKRQRLGLVAGVNLLNGGCGPAERRKCLPDIPGTALVGTEPGLYQLSAAELVYYKTVALSDPYVCASVDWSWGPAFRSGFHERPEIRGAVKVLGLIARRRPRSSCIQG